MVPAADLQVALLAIEKFTIEAHPAADLQELEFTIITEVPQVDLQVEAQAMSFPKQSFLKLRRNQQQRPVCFATVT